jgi:hypothetical protein
VAVDCVGSRKSFRFAIEDIEPRITKEFGSKVRKVEELLKKGTTRAVSTKRRVCLPKR